MVLAQAFRSLLGARTYSLAVVLTLALGLAAMGSMSAVVHGVLLAPLPYADPERLVDLRLELAEGGQMAHSPAVLSTYRRLSTRLQDLALYRAGSANVWGGPGDALAGHLEVSWISASTMRTLGVAPLIGRTFSEYEERRGGPDAVILSEAEWRARYGGAADVLGRTLVVNDVPREIVGVMPAGFGFPSIGTRLWLPAKHPDSTVAGEFFYRAVARLAPGATLADAERELRQVLPRMAESHPQLQSGGSTATWLEEARPVPRLRGLREAMTGDVAPALWSLAGVSGLVMLLVYANVANLMLIRMDARRENIALRQALGASPRRAHAQSMAESLLLGALAATLALLLSHIALGALRRFGPEYLPRLTELGVGAWSVSAVVLLALLGTVLVSAAVARLERPVSLAGRLQEGARGQTSGRSRQRLRASITALQIAVAMVVLAGSMVLLRSVQRLHDVHPGFDSAQVMSFRVLLPFARYGDVARVDFHATLTERVAGLPGVQAAGLVARLPLGWGHAVEQHFVVEGQRSPALAVNVISNGYFAAMRIPLLAGREFQRLDLQRPGELIISRGAALRLFSDPLGSESLGRTVTLDPGGPDYVVVGVVGDVHQEDLATPPAPMVYRPQVVARHPASEPGPLPGMTLVVRSDGSPEALVAALRGILRDMDPAVPLVDGGPLDALVRGSTERLRLSLWVMSVAAACALLLGMVGLYGILAYQVALRGREFGLRMALGASPSRINRLVLSTGVLLTATGLGIGLLAFAVLAMLWGASFTGIRPWDVPALLSAASLLGATAALACWLPAQDAAKVDPSQALRAE